MKKDEKKLSQTATENKVDTAGFPATKKARDEKGKWLPGHSGNPDGKGGFADNPDNINPGGRPKNQESFSYWMGYFKNMPVDEFIGWPKQVSTAQRTVAADIAYARVLNSRKDLAEFKEVADRTEGRAPQTLIHEGGFFATTRLEIEVVDDTYQEVAAEPETAIDAETVEQPADR